MYVLYVFTTLVSRLLVECPTFWGCGAPVGLKLLNGNMLKDVYVYLQTKLRMYTVYVK